MKKSKNGPGGDVTIPGDYATGIHKTYNVAEGKTPKPKKLSEPFEVIEIDQKLYVLQAL